MVWGVGVLSLQEHPPLSSPSHLALGRGHRATWGRGRPLENRLRCPSLAQPRL